MDSYRNRLPGVLTLAIGLVLAVPAVMHWNWESSSMPFGLILVWVGLHSIWGSGPRKTR